MVYVSNELLTHGWILLSDSTVLVKLVLVTFCDTNTGNGDSFQTHAGIPGRIDGGRTDKHGSWNSYSDFEKW